MEVVKMRNPFKLFPMEIWEVLFDQMEASKDILTVLHGIPKLDVSIGNQKRMWLIDQILPFLYNLIDKKDVLNLRLVCKQWLRRVDFFLQNQPYYRAYSEDLHKDDLKFWDFLNQYENNKFKGPVMFDRDYVDSELADKIVEHSQFRRRNPFVFRELSLDIVPSVSVPTSDNDNPFEKILAFLEQVGTHVWYLNVENFTWMIRTWTCWSATYARMPETTYPGNLLKRTPNLKRLRLALPLYFRADTLEPKPNETNLPELPFLETIEITAEDNWDVLTFESLLAILNRYGSQLRRLKIPSLKGWDVKGLANLFPQLTELELDVYILNPPNEVEDFLINTRIILDSILSRNLTKLQINMRPVYGVSWNEDLSNDQHRAISIEGDILKWLKRFPRIKYFELLIHPYLSHICVKDEIIILKEDGTSDPSKDLVSSLQTFKIVDPCHRLSYDFLRCFPSLRTLQIKAFSREMIIGIPNPDIVFVQPVKLYESNVWKALPELRTATFAGWCVDEYDCLDDIINHRFDRETFLKLQDAGKIPAESQFYSSSTMAIQVFVDDIDN